MSGDLWLGVLAAGLVAVAGLFAAAEAAISRLSRTQVDTLVREGRRGSGRLQAAMADPSRSLNLALLLRVSCEITAASLVVVIALAYLDNAAAAVALAALTMVLVSYVVVGVSPRTVGRQHAGTVGLISAMVLSPLDRVLGPVPRLLIALGNAVTPGRGFREGPFASEAELRDLVDLAEESRVIEDDERRMVHSVFELGDTIVREVMVPRTDMVYIEADKTLRQALSLALRSGFSRIPVVGDSEDDIVGVVYLKDLARRSHDRRDAESTELVATAMRPAAFVPDSKPVDALLREMQHSQSHIAILVNEYGGTAGLVTMEDLVEEIVGEIADEYDTERVLAEWLDPATVRVSARLPVTEFGALFERHFDVDDVETVGGLFAKQLGRVPIPGAQVVCDGLTLEAESTGGRRNRISTVLVTEAEPAEPARAAEPAETAPQPAEPAEPAAGSAEPTREPVDEARRGDGGVARRERAGPDAVDAGGEPRVGGRGQ